MNVSLKLEIENNEHYLVFTFDEALDEIDFLATPIDNLIFIYISNIDQQSFIVDSNKIKGAVLKLHLKFKVSFSA